MGLQSYVVPVVDASDERPELGRTVTLETWFVAQLIPFAAVLSERRFWSGSESDIDDAVIAAGNQLQALMTEVTGLENFEPEFRISGDNLEWRADSEDEWIDLGRVTGEQGEQGEQGLQGLQGLNGLDGQDGQDGDDADEFTSSEYWYPQLENETSPVVNDNLVLSAACEYLVNYVASLLGDWFVFRKNLVEGSFSAAAFLTSIATLGFDELGPIDDVMSFAKNLAANPLQAAIDQLARTDWREERVCDLYYYVRDTNGGVFDSVAWNWMKTNFQDNKPVQLVGQGYDDNMELLWDYREVKVRWILGTKGESSFGEIICDQAEWRAVFLNGSTLNGMTVERGEYVSGGDYVDDQEEMSGLKNIWLNWNFPMHITRIVVWENGITDNSNRASAVRQIGGSNFYTSIKPSGSFNRQFDTGVINEEVANLQFYCDAGSTAPSFCNVTRVEIFGIGTPPPVTLTPIE